VALLVGAENSTLHNQVAAYAISPSVWSEYEAEVKEWIANGWLRPFKGKCSGLVPLFFMAVVQASKDKVRPVMDYRELNRYVSSHTAEGDVCSAKLRAWRRMGEKCSIIDLRKAYLQLHVHPSLW